MPDLSGWLPLLANLLSKLIARRPRGLEEGSLRLKARDFDLSVRWKRDDRPTNR
jgi:hypothetical protein